LIKQLRESLAPFGPLSLAVAGLGVFPERGPPRVIWAGVSDSHQQLARLQGAIEQATAKSAPQGSPEQFRGHVTLGRVREARGGWRRDLEVFLKSRARTSFGMWTADRVELMRSELSSTGAIHYPLAEVVLAAK
jgi:2'-5' RNA ligase